MSHPGMGMESVDALSSVNNASTAGNSATQSIPTDSEVLSILEDAGVDPAEFDSAVQSLEGNSDIIEMMKGGLDAAESEELMGMINEAMGGALDNISNEDMMALAAYCASCLDGDASTSLPIVDAAAGTSESLIQPTDNNEDMDIVSGLSLAQTTQS
jgi:hypothetical protein